MIVIGRFKELYGADYPPIQNMIAENPIKRKRDVLQYLRGARIVCASPAVLIDVISGEHIHEELTCQTDGVYAWRSDIAYYFDRYNLVLPDAFINHALHNS